MNRKQRIAVVGAGISGLASAWLLSRQHDVTLFEAGDYLGGHTNTVDVTLEGKTHPVDTGFLVFNEKTYPNLIAMFALLGVDSVETEMSFAVSLENPDLEWAGSNLATVFGQKRNLLRRSFWAMLSDILRFNRESTAWLLSHPNDQRSLRDFLEAGKYSAAFSDWYLLPMAAAIWSCPTGQMRDMPLATFIRFCQNHGLLQIFDRPMWRTVRGGGVFLSKSFLFVRDDADVYGNHDVGVAARSGFFDGDVVDQSAIDQLSSIANCRGQHARNRHAGAHGSGQAAIAHHYPLAGADVSRHQRDRQGQLLDQAFAAVGADQLVEKQLDFDTVDDARRKADAIARNAQFRTWDEAPQRFLVSVIDLRKIRNVGEHVVPVRVGHFLAHHGWRQARGISAGDQGAHAGAGNAVDRNLQLL